MALVNVFEPEKVLLPATVAVPGKVCPEANVMALVKVLAAPSWAYTELPSVSSAESLSPMVTLLPDAATVTGDDATTFAALSTGEVPIKSLPAE